MPSGFQELVEYNDRDDIEVFLDNEAVERSKTIKHANMKKIGFAVALLLCVMTIMFALAIVVPVVVVATRTKTPDPPSYASWADMRNSVEFQIMLSTPQEWIRRDDMIKKWVTAMNAHNSFNVFNTKDAEMDVYLQFHLSTGGHDRCRSTGGMKVRYRSYVFGKKYTLDIKKDEDYNESCNQPYWPAREYYDTAEWKCEEDVHPCFTKYTMESRVYIDDPFRDFNTCEELVEVFPDAFPHVDDGNKHNSIKMDFNGYWYKLQWRGMTGNYTNFEVTFTIQYRTMVEATSGIAEMVTGEWSLRFYVPHGQKWEEDVVNEFEQMYFSLILLFDNTKEDQQQCARDYLNGNTEIGLSMDDQIS